LVVKLHPHAVERLEERGAREDEVVETVESGEQFPAKLGRTGFRHNFQFGEEWRGKLYSTKQVEAIAVLESGDWVVITVIVRFF